MKDKIFKVLKVFFISMVMVLAVFAFFKVLDEKPTFADSGFGTSYSGGSSHSSSSHSSSSHSSSSSRSRSSSYGSSSSSSSGSGSIGELALVVIIVFIIVIVSAIKSRNKGGSTNITAVDDSAVENKIKQFIPDFNKKEFLQNGYDMYVKIQNAWMDFKLDDVKDIITDEIYTMYDSQLTTLEVKGEKNIMKDFVLRNCYLTDVVKQNDTITITTNYSIEFYDYIIEEQSGKVMRGNSNRKIRSTYEMKFRMSLDESDKVDKCPNCGAPIEMNSSGICQYCGAKLVSENTKWVLTEKKTTNQIML